MPDPAFDPATYRSGQEGKQQPKGRAKAAASAPAVKGWQSGKGATLKIEAGELCIMSAGDDPWISTVEIPKDLAGSLHSHFG